MDDYVPAVMPTAGSRKTWTALLVGAGIVPLGQALIGVAIVLDVPGFREAMSGDGPTVGPAFAIPIFVLAGLLGALLVWVFRIHLKQKTLAVMRPVPGGIEIMGGSKYPEPVIPVVLARPGPVSLAQVRNGFHYRSFRRAYALLITSPAGSFLVGWHEERNGIDAGPLLAELARQGFTVTADDAIQYAASAPADASATS